MLDVSNFPSILRLHKQRYKCHSCNKKFFAKTNIVNDGCFISNQVKYAIALDLKQELWYVKIYYIWKKQMQTSTHLFKFLYHYFGLHPLFDKEPKKY